MIKSKYLKVNYYNLKLQIMMMIKLAILKWKSLDYKKKIYLINK